MAHLNLRERRIETTIAFISTLTDGSEASSSEGVERALHNAELVALIQRAIASVDAKGAAVTESNDVLSIAWHPPDRGRFRDCEVVMNVVAPRSTHLTPALHDVDAVVLAVEASVARQAQSRAALANVREALSTAARAVPIVLHIDERGSDAVGAESLAVKMDGQGLPRVVTRSNAGLHGDIIATLNTALEEALSAFQAPNSSTGSSTGSSASSTARSTEGAESDSGEEKATARPGAIHADARASDEAHPLLTALQKVLRQTMLEYMTELEARVMTRLDARLGKPGADVEMKELRTQMGDSFAALEEKIHLLDIRMTQTVEELKPKKGWLA